MTGPSAGPNPASPRRGTYFFLSYAHSVPISAGSRPDTDYWVNQFFADLSAEVRHRARPVADLDFGFFDGMAAPGSELRAVLADALSETQVFVPLYSPSYFSKTWALGERESFLARLAHAGPSAARRHIAPVLWIPLPPWDRRPEVREAIELGGALREYTENGLRALCMLRAYRKQYEATLARLAQRIVDVAERTPLPPSQAPALQHVAATTPGETALVVTVLAPTKADAPGHRPPDTYGATSTQWRPFATKHSLPIAEYVASTAERLGLPTHIAPYTDARELAQTNPVVLLVDPWLIGGAKGAGQVRSALEQLPPWVVALVVADGDDPGSGERGGSLPDRAAAMLLQAGLPEVQWVREADEFVQVMPVLVTEARKQFLKNGPVYPPAGPVIPRPRLSGRRPPGAGPGQEESR